MIWQPKKEKIKNHFFLKTSKINSMDTVELLITEYSIQTLVQNKLKLKELKKVNSKVVN